MKPRNTTYRIAHSSKDYHACRELFAQNHGADPSVHFQWPTVVAERNGEVIGFLTTERSHGRIMAGPLEVKGGKNIFIFIRLIEAYTNVMRAAGISFFEFYVPSNRVDIFGPKQLAAYADFGVKFNQYYMGNAFFVKEVA